MCCTEWVEIQVTKKHIFLNGYEPPKQIAIYLDSLAQETLEEGATIAQVAENVSYVHDSWSAVVRHQSIGHYLDKDKYVVRAVVSDRTKKNMIFPKGADPSEQITAYLNSLKLEAVIKGVPH